MALNTLFYKEIRHHHLFADFSEDSLQLILQNSGIISLKKNENLFKCSDIANHFFLTRSGQITLFQTSLEGNEKTISIVEAGQSFAETSMFNQKNYYSINAKATCNADVFYFSSSVFRAQLQNSNQSCLAMMAEMSHRLTMQTQEIIELSIHDAQYRLINYLLDNSCQPDIPDCHLQVKLSVTKSLLASRLSITPETFSRILTRLRKQNLIVIKDDVIILTDHDALTKQVAYCAARVKQKNSAEQILDFTT